MRPIEWFLTYKKYLFSPAFACCFLGMIFAALTMDSDAYFQWLLGWLIIFFGIVFVYDSWSMFLFMKEKFRKSGALIFALHGVCVAGIMIAGIAKSLGLIN